MVVPPDLSVVILSWNTWGLLEPCLRSLPAAVGGLRTQVVVVDNGSTDGSADRLARDFPSVELIRSPVNLGYARGVNRGLAATSGRWVALLGSDTEAAPGSLERLVQFLRDEPRCGAVAPRLENFDGTVQRACMRFPSLTTVLYWDTPLGRWWPRSRELVRYQMLDWDHLDTREVEQPPGTCLVLPRAVLERLGPMDGDLWLFFNDVDWARRLDALGLRRWYVADAVVRHHLGGSTRHFADFGVEWHKNRIRYYRKHFGPLGAFLTKAVLVHVAARQVGRVLRAARWSRAALPEIGRLLRSAWELLFEGARRPRRHPWH